MKKLVAMLAMSTFAIAACGSQAATNTSEAANDLQSVTTAANLQEAAATLSDLQDQATNLTGQIQSSNQAAELRQVFDVVSQNLSEVADAATAGDVSSQDVESLQNSLGDLQTNLTQLSDQIDPDLRNQLESFRDQIQTLIPQLMNQS